MTLWEHGLIALLLGTDAPGSRALRAQLPGARVEGRCGCRSLYLVVDPASPPARTWSPFPVEAVAAAADGAVVEAVLVLDAGRLAMLLLIWHDDTPRPLPPLPAWRRTRAA